MDSGCRYLRKLFFSLEQLKQLLHARIFEKIFTSELYDLPARWNISMEEARTLDQTFERNRT